MASISIFTYDHDPPRVSSPWSTPPPGARAKHSIPQDPASDPSRTIADAGIATSSLSTIDSSTVTKLEAEPQDGPTEYKLHLLLRRRRSFTRTTTGKNIFGSLRRIEPTTVSRSVSDPALLSNSPVPIAATQSRQHRLEQLTTQLYWRLQQSCPHHVSSSSPLVIPQFPDEAQLSIPALPRRLLPGLEESKGALYEIGVADDGTLVGLAEDEMEESLGNLRAMAASLGCRVDVLRMVEVGDCEWVEANDMSGTSLLTSRSGKLWVAEALVIPDQHFVEHAGDEGVQDDTTLANPTNPAANGSPPTTVVDGPQSPTQQLRISLTGATLSGKSSLLGSLSHSTLDNGRGSSRLSLLKHVHEIASGLTSSVTQELIGYHDVVGSEGKRDSVQVINYGTGDVSEWLEIHASAEDGRLVFLSDSPGLPRYRRTTVRGLIGWDPHWVLLCISADSTQDGASKSQESLGPTVADIDLWQTHLQLCLNLEVPLVVVITKFDLATKQSLAPTLSRVLSAIKETGRAPRILQPGPVSEIDLNTITADDLGHIGPTLQALESSPLAEIPIILTSAVKGSGITRLHALLRELPLPDRKGACDEALQTLFYIEDVYSKIEAPAVTTSLTGSSSNRSLVIGGHLRYGTLRIGQELLLGPFAIDTSSEDSDSGSGARTPQRAQRQSPVPASRSFPGALHEPHSRPGIMLPAQDRGLEWRRVRIMSLRNLRLPVRSLHAGQVGSIGLAAVGAPISSPGVVVVRKGMVLVDGAGRPKARNGLAVRFDGPNAEAVKSLSVGSGVIVYVASVRAPSTVVSIAVEKGADSKASNGAVADEPDDLGFGFNFDDEYEAESADEAGSPDATVVTFRFHRLREFYEVGAKVLILPFGGPGLSCSTERGEKGVAALDGYVGRVVEGY